MKVLGLVLHLSASKWGDAEEITKWHKERGFQTIGYHAVILNGIRKSNMVYQESDDGLIQMGRPESQNGAHCLAHGMNTCSLGVCCVGTPGFPPDNVDLAPSQILTAPYMTEKQYHSLIHWLRVNCKQYGLDPHGTFKHPVFGNRVPVITQHSTHDMKKPFCASINLVELRKAV